MMRTKKSVLLLVLQMIQTAWIGKLAILLSFGRYSYDTDQSSFAFIFLASNLQGYTQDRLFKIFLILLITFHIEQNAKDPLANSPFCICGKTG